MPIPAVSHLAARVAGKLPLRQQFWQQTNLNPLLQGIFFPNEPGEAIGYGRFQSEELVKQAEKLTGGD